MRSIWKGTVSFGLVTIPVKLYSATEERDVAFHQVRRSDGSRIKYKRVAEADGEEVPYAEIAKGFELPTGETVVLTDEDFADLPLATQKTVEVLQFVPLEEVDPIYFASPTTSSRTRPGSSRTSCCARRSRSPVGSRSSRWRFASGRPWPCLRVRDGVLVMETMLWPDEMRSPTSPSWTRTSTSRRRR